MDDQPKIHFDSARRIIVKVGSGVLTGEDGLNLKIVRSLSRQICRLIDQGLEVILVTSGAMACGIKKMALKKRPDEIPKRQASAAIGQAGLILEYEKAFEKHHKKVAQILLTSDDLFNRKRYLNARNTIHTLLSWKVVPIINENDTVIVEEIKFGDNDNLSALIALLMDADILINLTDIDGLYTKDPRKHPDAELIGEITTITRELENFASGISGTLGMGGMLSKIRAAKKVTAAGIPMVIANGKTPDILIRLFSGEKHGSFFSRQNEKMARRKCWIAFTLKPKGRIIVDKGAAAAMVERGTSLLPSGVIQVEGDFPVGSPVQVLSEDLQVLGNGLVNYSAAETRQIMGLKSHQIKERLGYQPYDEIIHRDNLVIMADACDMESFCSKLQG
ncbi:MAG: glutamate 5-kinase [Desulfobacterales bacterium]|nr:glutamate 5-kinase [Desulfobacterales bacterium]